MFERVNDRIKAQIEKVEDMTGDMDPKTNFALIVIQTELERYKFLVRSYLRARMAKVSSTSKHCQAVKFCLALDYLVVKSTMSANMNLSD